MKLALDVLGGKIPPKEVMLSVFDFLADLPQWVQLVLIGTPDLRPLLPKHRRIEFFEAENAISHADDPLVAVRKKKQSSMALGVSLLKEKKVKALVSMGNTGALVAFCTLHLSLLPGFTKPALLVPIPLKDKVLVIGDVGANVDCTSQQYVQFAKMGIQFQKKNYGLSCSKVALLNIGMEGIKGGKVVRQAYQALKKSAEESEELDFVGNVEGNHVFTSDLDVLVCDGFSGNIFLKTAEGICRLIFTDLTEAELAELPFSRFTAAFMGGLDDLVVKCHGDSCIRELKEGIILASSLL